MKVRSASSLRLRTRKLPYWQQKRQLRRRQQRRRKRSSRSLRDFCQLHSPVLNQGWVVVVVVVEVVVVVAVMISMVR